MEDKEQSVARYLSPDERSNFLTLKEAAQLTDYTADYLGQLMREGKLEGFQVYTSTSWVTTEKAVREYVAHKGKQETLEDFVWYRDPQIYLRTLLYLVIGCLGMLLLGMIGVVAVSIDRSLSDSALMEFDERHEN